jgi:hypothetical protein
MGSFRDALPEVPVAAVRSEEIMILDLIFLSLLSWMIRAVWRAMWQLSAGLDPGVEQYLIEMRNYEKAKGNRP